MTSMLEQVRAPLLAEARQSPSLLSDLAGLEHYVAESYDSRSFVELLQNADDARATRFTVRLFDDFLLVANDGRRFTPSDFESLCRSASSTKSRGSTIGYRGIGFKSVVHYSREVFVFSGELEAVFSRERTARDVPNAFRCPLIRIPHPVLPSERDSIKQAIDEAKADGYETVFILAGIDISAVEVEFGSFSPSALLFLRSVRQVDLRTASQKLFVVSRTELGGNRTKIRLVSNDGPSEWLIHSGTDTAIAFGIREEVVSSLPREEAVVHAFLPTLEPTGFGIKINGDFSTDPSRTRVVLDEVTERMIHEIADLYVTLLDESIGTSGPGPAVQLSALVPDTDPRMVELQRPSFRVNLLKGILLTADKRCRNIRLKPTWLNYQDFVNLAKASRFKLLPEEAEEVPGASQLFKSLGAEEFQLSEALDSVRTAPLSSIGAAEMLASVARQREIKQVDPSLDLADLRLWLTEEGLQSLNEAGHHPTKLEPDFIALLSDKGVSFDSLRRLIIELSDSTTADVLLQRVPQPTSDRIQSEVPNRIGIPSSLSGITRWRNAEMQLVELLNSQGWSVIDVSRRNEGYDISGVTPGGTPIHIEVKSVDSFQAPFIMTNNELLVARQLKDRYAIALVRSNDKGIEVAFIEDPGNALTLNRQCRQWVWECEQFSVNPMQYLYED